jgi:tetratricopeptide (TPR) repeat protein
MTSRSLKKWLLVSITFAACLLSAYFLVTAWKVYQAEQDVKRAEELISSKKNIDKGLTLLESARFYLSDNVYFLKKYGGILSGLGKKQEAIQVYEAALDSAYFPSMLERLSFLYLETKQFEKSIDFANQALNTLPWKLTPRFTMAAAYLGSGKKDKAFEYALETIITPEKHISDRGISLKQKARDMLPLCIPEGTGMDEKLTAAVSGLVSPEQLSRLSTALLAAGENRPELEETILEISPSRLEAFIFLLLNMPESDLRNLDSGYLLENIDCAFQVQNIWPFLPEIPKDIFLNYLLPYAQLGEKRDSWRKDFMTRWMPAVNECKSVGEVVMSLQIWLPHKLELTFDNENRSHPDWSVGEIIKHKTGNCVGFSIMLADACRSVGIPARVATIPKWKDVPGGHAWVEVWDQGEWRHISAFDQSPMNRTWMEKRTAETDTTEFNHRIYGASFRRTDIQIRRYGPNVWWTDVSGNYVK